MVAQVGDVSSFLGEAVGGNLYPCAGLYSSPTDDDVNLYNWIFLPLLQYGNY